ncbi:carboxymuconolactone decarboxylase family protein [Geotalea uraniireducens]|uniref:Alkylhydroperoxidase like protein, AhpD family n=1 Tax=Geotalea uraniireducens (strain Rf4) TaxID=351605 RepID=A5G4B0_GEOUR|nr:carboxymuconolactone decarboxylase family protein [Geotalea uraniireducens]ABQ26628.1 alkylhydroperoxidase like protein, AhpD family [Geotalea uraniireducens Rf4]
MELNDRIRELIAVGASITANCQPCLRIHVEKALKSGADPQEVTAAIEIGKRVRKGAADKMETFSSNLQAGKSQGFEVVMEGNGYQFLGP